MAGATRTEINFNRLLGQCQAMAEDKENRDWRFDKVELIKNQEIKILQSSVDHYLHNDFLNLRSRNLLTFTSTRKFNGPKSF